MTNRIIFVDDEPLVLEGLRLSFRSMRGEWSMDFAAGGEQALQAMEKQPFDLVVTDLRMPGMPGVQLLDEVGRRFPQTIRIALSGQCDQETIIRSVGSIHQYLAKPCDRELLKSKIQQAFALRDLLGNSTLKAVVSQLRTIPSLPASYQAILAELQSSKTSLEKVAKLIATDVGMTAKCLQLVNSAFFALRGRISSPHEAVKFLGQDTLRALVLSTHIFSEFQRGAFAEGEIDWLWDHSLAVSTMAGALARLQSVGTEIVEESFTAGLLHDVGKLILAASMNMEYRSVLDLAVAKNINISAAEREVLGCSHTEVGAYLLGIWGLPYPIQQAVAWHQKPSDSPAEELSCLTVVHAACVFHGEMHPSPLCDQSPLDVGHFTKLGIEDQIDSWRTALQKRSPLE